MTLASFPMTSISSKAHKIDFSYFLFTVDATFLYYVQSRNLAEKISNPAVLVVPVRVTQTLYFLECERACICCKKQKRRNSIA